MHVALAQDVLRFFNLTLPDTAVPTKLITTRTQSVPDQIEGSLSSPANTVMSPHSPQTTNPKLTYQLRNVQQRTHVPPVATLLSSSMTKFCGSVTNYITCLLIHTKSVPTGTVLAMTLGIPTGHLGSISTARLHRCSQPDRTSSLNNRSRRTGRWRSSRLSKLRLYFGIQRICTCPDRSQL